MADEQATTFLSIRHKVVFIGNPTAGKTSLLNRIVNDTFKPDYDSTIGVDFFTKTIFYGETLFKVQLWDSAGQEKYKSLIPSYIRGASIIFLIYDISNYETFESIKNWLGFINQFTNREQAKIVLVGNKNDLSRKVTKEEGEAFAKNENMSFYETSAKTGDGVTYMFYSAFCLIDFFNDKKQNLEELIKDLIEQNASPVSIDTNNNAKSEQVLINKDMYNKELNNNNNQINIDNIGKIELQNKQDDKGKKKKCAC